MVSVDMAVVEREPDFYPLLDAWLPIYDDNAFEGLSYGGKERGACNGGKWSESTAQPERTDWVERLVTNVAAFEV